LVAFPTLPAPLLCCNRLILAFIVVATVVGGEAMAQNTQPDAKPIHLGFLEQIQDAAVPAEGVLLLDRFEPVPAWFGSDTTDSQRLCDFVDKSFIANWVTHTQSGSTASLYQLVLNNSEWGRKAFNQVEDEQFKQLTEKLFRKVDGQWLKTDEYAYFKELQREYFAVKQEYDSTPPQNRTADLIRRYKRARDRYNVEGQAPVFLDAERLLASLLRYDASKGIRVDMQKRLNANLDENGRPRSSLVPTFEPLRARWQEVKFDAKLVVPSEAPFGYLPKALRADFFLDEQPAKGLPSPGSLAVAFDIAVFRVERPWFDDMSLIRSRMWRWSNDLLSDGQKASDDHQSPPLRVLPVALVLIRNVKMQAREWPSELINRFSSATHSQQHVRLGPLAIAGRFISSFGSVDLSPVPYGNNIILIPTTQLMAVHVQWVLKTPDPATNLIWGNPLPDLPLRSESKMHIVQE
jgi:hypothetical protein